MPSCGQRRFLQIYEGQASPAQHSYVEKRRADIQRPAAVAEVALVSLRLLCGRE
jgi:hypothetical protein